MKVIHKNPHIIDLLSCNLNILWVIDLSLYLLNISKGIYSIPKDLKYIAVFLSINNETQCVILLFLSSRFMTYAPSFIAGKLFLEKKAKVHNWNNY